MKKLNVYLNSKNLMYFGYENEKCKIKNLVNTNYAIFKWIVSEVEYSIKVNLKYAKPQHVNGDLHFQVQYLPEQKISVGRVVDGNEIEYLSTTIDRFAKVVGLETQIVDIESSKATNDLQQSNVWL